MIAIVKDHSFIWMSRFPKTPAVCATHSHDSTSAIEENMGKKRSDRTHWTLKFALNPLKNNERNNEKNHTHPRYTKKQIVDKLASLSVQLRLFNRTLNTFVLTMWCVKMQHFLVESIKMLFVVDSRYLAHSHLFNYLHFLFRFFFASSSSKSFDFIFLIIEIKKRTENKIRPNVSSSKLRFNDLYRAIKSLCIFLSLFRRSLLLSAFGCRACISNAAVLIACSWNTTNEI